MYGILYITLLGSTNILTPENFLSDLKEVGASVGFKL